MREAAALVLVFMRFLRAVLAPRFLLCKKTLFAVPLVFVFCFAKNESGGA